MHPARFMPRFRRARRVVAELEQVEQWSRGDIERLQLNRINAIWRHAIAHVPYYRHLKVSADLPEQFCDLEQFKAQVPVLQKDTVRSGGDDFLSERAGPGKWYCTGGSTGTPMRLFWSSKEYRRALCSRYRFYASHGADLFDPVVYLWGADHRLSSGVRGFIERLGETVCDQLRNRRRFSAYELDGGHLAQYLREIEAFRPTMIYGFSQAVHMLAREAIRNGFECDSLRVVTMTSEVATPAMVLTVQRAFGAPVVMEYGATECPLIAGQDNTGAWRVREDLAMVETLPRNDGRFDVVLTVLGNSAFPLLRYVIEDVVDAPIHTPPRGLACIGAVSGRDDELLVSGDGKPIHATLVDIVFEAEPAVRRY
ncbi:MAG: hypothetical protein QF735_12640, partial [Phycisphaeraceae bacterium]|nr:hypothetical protein [Phycisphaeraceae bacterium]